MAAEFDSIDAYIASFPPDVRVVLEDMRSTIHAAVPGLGERISYGIPTMTIAGRTLLSFAAWAKHVSVYPTPTGDAAFELEIAPYRSSKSTAKFPLSEPVPYELVGRIAALIAGHRPSG